MTTTTYHDDRSEIKTFLSGKVNKHSLVPPGIKIDEYAINSGLWVMKNSHMEVNVRTAKAFLQGLYGIGIRTSTLCPMVKLFLTDRAAYKQTGNARETKHESKPSNTNGSMQNRETTHGRVIKRESNDVIYTQSIQLSRARGNAVDKPHDDEVRSTPHPIDPPSRPPYVPGDGIEEAAIAALTLEEWDLAAARDCVLKHGPQIVLDTLALDKHRHPAVKNKQAYTHALIQRRVAATRNPKPSHPIASRPVAPKASLPTPGPRPLAGAPDGPTPIGEAAIANMRAGLTAMLAQGASQSASMARMPRRPPIGQTARS